MIVASLSLFPHLAQAFPPLTFTNLHSFSVFPNGADPNAGLTQASNGVFYGTTFGGGTNGGNGTVFKITTNGVTTVLYEFTGGLDGGNPGGGLVFGNDGFLYGTTEYGGTNGSGNIFSISTNGVLNTVYSFTGGPDGGNPVAGLVLGFDGNFYGTAQNGGSNGYGTVFQVMTNGALNSLYSFANGTDGANPYAALTQGSDGKFYGTTYGGGSSNSGIVFGITTNGTLTNLHTFAGGTNDGENPRGVLVQGTNGVLYGTTESGGASRLGTAFQITTNGVLTLLHSFGLRSKTILDGSRPAAGMVQSSSGILYGTLADGGRFGSGAVFKLTLINSNSTVIGSNFIMYSFTGNADGAISDAALALGSDGNLYGTAAEGGVGYRSGGGGTVFKITPSGTFSPLEAFPGTNDGQTAAALVHGTNGILYGTSLDGGTNGLGNIFTIMTNGVLTDLYSFTGGNDGAIPTDALVEGSDGNFYGTAQQDGIFGNGTVFSITPGGALNVLYSFTGGTDGAAPAGALVLGADGNFYGGTTASSGNNLGTIFKVSAGGNLKTLYTFTGGTDGSHPNNLLQGLDGNFYGTSPDGGTNASGAVFVMSPGGALTVLYSFTGGSDGGSPTTALAQAGDGNFYGTTSSGGTNSGSGTIFRITPAGSLTTLYSFGGSGNGDGDSPSALLAGTDGNFYATTSDGGANGFGNVFELLTNGNLFNLYSFAGVSDGGVPMTALVQGSDGSLFGTTSVGATGGYGGVFRLSGPQLPSPLPVITMQPSNPPLAVAGIDPAAMNIGAFGGAPLSFEWRLNGQALLPGGDFSGVGLGTLTVNPTAPADAGSYSVVVSNSYGSVTSSNAVLSLIAPSNTLEEFEAGTNYLAAGDFLAAELSFSNALASSPTNSTYGFFLAATELLTLPQEPAGSNFLDHIGYSSAGRDIANWQARLTNKIPIGVNADEFTAELRTNVLPAIAGAQANLAQIADTNFTVDLTASETHAGAVTVDWGDVQMMQSISQTAELFIYTTYSWNLNVQLTTASNILASTGSYQALLTNFPNLLTTTSTADLPLAKAAFTNAISNYFVASQFIRNRPTNEVRLFNLDAAEAKKELAFRQTLSNLLASLNGPVALTGNPAYTVSAAAFFSTNFNLRSYLPEFQDGEFVWDTFPDVTFGGVITGLSQQQVGRAFLKHFETAVNVPGITTSVLYDFTNFSSQMGVVQAPDGTLYGTLNHGGPFTAADFISGPGVGYGSVFKVTTNGQFSVIYNFGSRTNAFGLPSDGAYPNAVILASDGNLYGTTQSGGLSYYTNMSSNVVTSITTNYYSGTIFKITTAGQLTTLYNFGTQADEGASTPFAALAQGSDGRLYGTTAYCRGTNFNGYGTVFAISTNGNFTLLNWFAVTLVTNATAKGTNSINVPLNGANPATPLAQGSDGNLYGTTSSGGGLTSTNIVSGVHHTNTYPGFGTIYRVVPSTGQLTVLYVFGTQQDGNGDPLDGALANGLVQGSDGNLYGTTQGGGANDDFNISLNGGFYFGSGYGDGTLFRISPTNAGSFTTLLSFDENFSDGYNPIGSLVPGANGSLYGVASAGGADKRGAVFVYSTNGAATNLVWLNKSLGSYGNNLQSFLNFQSFNFGPGSPLPAPSLLAEGADGNLYGTTTDDGANGDGTIYKLAFAGVSGANAPSVSTQPVSQSVLAGSNVTFSVTASGSQPLRYRWFFNSKAVFNAGNISGATSNLLTLTGLSAGEAGSYFVIVSNSLGSAASTVATLTVLLPPTILTNPVSQLVASGASANFAVVAGGTLPLGYQWQVNGSNIAGATLSSLTAANAGTYDVVVTNAYGSATSASAQLTIQTNITVAHPTVTITVPSSGGRTTNLVKGTATGPDGIWNVFYTLTNLNQVTNVMSGQAALTAGSSSKSVLWSVTNILPGTNIIAVHAEDFTGKSSPTVTRHFFNVSGEPLDLVLTGSGAGKVALKAFAPGEKPTTNALNIGEQYQITAIPSAGSLFGGWTASTPTNSKSTNKSSFDFVMESDLTLTADFESNIFLGASGAYNGLFMVSNSFGAVTEDTAGMLGSLAVRTNGNYSGKLSFEGATYPITGAFDAFGGATNKIARSHSPVWLTMTLLATNNPPMISGSVIGTNNTVAWAASLLADRASSALSPAEYTMLIPPVTNSLPPNLSPGGDGYALITNSQGTAKNPGNAKIAGALADGTLFNQTVPVSQDGYVPIYANLYSSKGLLLGWVNLNLTNTNAASVTGLAWIHPPRAVGLYQKGFTNIILTNAIQLSVWSNSSALAGLTNLLILDTINDTNALTNFHLAVSPAGKLGPAPLSGSINLKTGQFQVNFDLGSAKTTGFGAILLNGTNYGGGYYLTKTNNAQAIKLEH